MWICFANCLHPLRRRQDQVETDKIVAFSGLVWQIVEAYFAFAFILPREVEWKH